MKKDSSNSTPQSDTKVAGLPRNLLGRDYSRTIHSYANQSSLQLSSDDVAMQFGVTSVDENGEPFVNVESHISMSISHFERFIKNCNSLLEEIKKLDAK